MSHSIAYVRLYQNSCGFFRSVLIGIIALVKREQLRKYPYSLTSIFQFVNLIKRIPIFIFADRQIIVYEILRTKIVPTSYITGVFLF